MCLDLTHTGGEGEAARWEILHICEANDCGLLFVDASRPGTRRWCSMEWCGDRAKKRAAGRPVRQGDIP